MIDVHLQMVSTKGARFFIIFFLFSPFVILSLLFSRRSDAKPLVRLDNKLCEPGVCRLCVWAEKAKLSLSDSVALFILYPLTSIPESPLSSLASQFGSNIDADEPERQGQRTPNLTLCHAASVWRLVPPPRVQPPPGVRTTRLSKVVSPSSRPPVVARAVPVIAGGTRPIRVLGSQGRCHLSFQLSSMTGGSTSSMPSLTDGHEFEAKLSAKEYQSPAECLTKGTGALFHDLRRFFFLSFFSSLHLLNSELFCFAVFGHPSPSPSIPLVSFPPLL